MAVTRAQIEAVYQALKAEGKEPTTRAIRTRLGDKGSLATINTVIRDLEGRGTSAELSAPTPLSVPQSFVDQVHQAIAPVIQSIFQLAEDHANQRVQAAVDLARQIEAERDEVEEQNRQFENQIESLEADINDLKR